MRKRKTYLLSDERDSGPVVRMPWPDTSDRRGRRRGSEAMPSRAPLFLSATLASELNAMKELLASQRRQIEKLQSALEKQQEISTKRWAPLRQNPRR